MPLHCHTATLPHIATLPHCCIAVAIATRCHSAALHLYIVGKQVHLPPELRCHGVTSSKDTTHASDHVSVDSSSDDLDEDKRGMLLVLVLVYAYVCVCVRVWEGSI